jgi:hypothetical protein
MLFRDFEDCIEFYRHPQRKAGNADDQPNRRFLYPKDIAKEVRHGIGDFGLVEEVPGGSQEDSEADDASYSIEGAQMLFGRSEDAQSRGVGGFPSGLDIELFAQPANKLRLVVDDWEHSAKEEQVAGLYCFDVGAERRRGGRELNAKVERPDLHCPAAKVRGLPSAHLRSAQKGVDDGFGTAYVECLLDAIPSSCCFLMTLHFWPGNERPLFTFTSNRLREPPCGRLKHEFNFEKFCFLPFHPFGHRESKERALESHISQRTSEMWGTRHLFGNQGLEL